MTSLLDTVAMWQSNPYIAFDTFIQSEQFLALGRRRSRANSEGDSESQAATFPLRESSVKIYRSMFATFLTWLDSRNVALASVTSADIAAFLSRKTEVWDEHQKMLAQIPVLNSRIKQKYLGLLLRVFISMDVVPNPAQHVEYEAHRGQDRSKIGVDAESARLTDSQLQQFIAALPECTTPDRTKNGTHGWKQRRDRAMQSLLVGAGLKVVEVIGLYFENLSTSTSADNMSVTISPASAGGIVRWHQSMVSAFAVPEIQSWVSERKALQIPGPYLFPATLNGGQLNKATVYRQVRATFERAGLDISRLGGRTLRNTFAVRELKAGHSIETVGEYMGHRKKRSTQHYASMVDTD